MERGDQRNGVVWAGIILGLGLGGFVDGIVLHQILQWHHLVSVPYPPTSVPNLQHNTFWDGLFHASTWVLTTIGLVMLWRAVQGRAVQLSGRVLAGAMAMGWGLFNLVEGIIDHHLLGIHHVRLGPDQLLWDLAFLAFGAVLFAAGGWLVRQSRGEVATRRPVTTPQ